jgi:ATP-dependent DNA helicase RecG
MVTARITDGTATISAAWFNQPWLADQLQPGTHVRLRGKPGRYGFDVKSHDIGAGDATADFAPVYPASEEITPKRMRTLVTAALGHVSDYFDPLPAELREREGMPLKRDALFAIHRPASEGEAEAGRARLAFEELLLLQIGIARRAAERERTLAPSLGAPGELIARYRQTLPFALTPYQEQAVREIDADLERTVPMQRLLQGDVGSGKTVVALYAILRAVEHGRQGALMAPTETLAEQHFLTIEGICAELGVTCALLTSASPKKTRADALGADVVVGTHALIQEGVELRDLAVAVVDEQHRFGVEQRKALALGRAPHVLHMTATPIPRTLALTVYGDLAVSEIAKPPASRKPIVTSWIEEGRASEAYTRLTRLLREGRQAYVVCPLVEESEALQAKAATAEFERLRSTEFRDQRVELIHGQMSTKAKQAAMEAFANGDADVLVATSVIEVGIDVPNATVMVIEAAERYGLSQLHQLRGRVGRGGHSSICILFGDAKLPRLEAIANEDDGFRLAEVDLEIRGAGDVLGTRQHGLPELRVARLPEDTELLAKARDRADELLRSDPELAEPEHALLRDAVVARFGSELDPIPA